MAALYAEGAAALQHYRDVTLADSDVNQIAARRWQGVNGAVANLNAQWQDLTVTLGESGVDQFLANSINLVATLVGGLGRLGDLMSGLPGVADAQGGIRQISSRLVAEQTALRQAQEGLARFQNNTVPASGTDAAQAERRRLEASIPRLQSNVAALQAALDNLRRSALPEVNVGVDVYSPAQRRAFNRRLAESLAVAGNGDGIDAEGLRQALEGTHGLTAAQREGRTAQQEFNSALSGAESPMERYVDELKNLLGLQDQFPNLRDAISSVLGRTTKDFLESQASARGLSDELHNFVEGDPRTAAALMNALRIDIDWIGEGGDRATLGVRSLTGTINTLMIALNARTADYSNSRSPINCRVTLQHRRNV